MYSLKVRSAVVLVVAVSACAPPMRSTASNPSMQGQLAELWVEPPDLAGRDLFYGAGGPSWMPDPAARYEFVARDTTGYSPGYDVRDASGLVWSVKVGPEAQTEVVVSRVLWAVGYHQPPTYHVRSWTLTGGPEPGPKLTGRFRPELPTHKKIGDWSWQQNPFVGTLPFRGLIVANLLLNNWDFKTSNNALYDLTQEMEGAARWYVVRDLGASLGRTRFLIIGTRNDLGGFERQGFITGVRNDRVQFDYLGRHRELLRDLTPADVRWVCSLLARLTAKQWQDAFRAGAYSVEQSDRYIRKIQEKIKQGLSVGAP